PWGASGRGLRTVVDTLGVLVSGYRDAGPVPMLLAAGLIALAVFGRAIGRRRFEIDLAGPDAGRPHLRRPAAGRGRVPPDRPGLRAPLRLGGLPRRGPAGGAGGGGLRRRPAPPGGPGGDGRARRPGDPAGDGLRADAGGHGGPPPPGVGPARRRRDLLPRPARAVGQPVAAGLARRDAAHLPPGRRPPLRRLGRLRRHHPPRRRPALRPDAAVAGRAGPQRLAGLVGGLQVVRPPLRAAAPDPRRLPGLGRQRPPRLAQPRAPRARPLRPRRALRRSL